MWPEEQDHCPEGNKDRQVRQSQAGQLIAGAIWPEQAGAGAHSWQPAAKAPNLRTGQVLAASSL